MAASAGKSLASGKAAVNPAVIADVIAVLARHNPSLSKTALEAAGRVVAAVAAATACLGPDQQRRIVTDERELTKAVDAAVSSLVTVARRRLARAPVEPVVEVSRGSGLDQSIDLEEGRRRLAAFAHPCRLEDWAGPVAGPSEIKKAFGTKRSTLYDWQKRGAIIGLLAGERKHVFPLAQFVDGRPVEGMAQVTQIIRNPRVAWQWLIQSKPSIDGMPLDKLKSGQLGEVLEAAERDFG